MLSLVNYDVSDDSESGGEGESGGEDVTAPSVEKKDDATRENCEEEEGKRQSSSLQLTANHSRTVKISIPSLKEFENDEPSKKKIKRGTGGSGLVGLLPAPKNVVSAKTSAGQLLIPHALSRKSSAGSYAGSTMPDANAKPLHETEPFLMPDGETGIDFFNLSDEKTSSPSSSTSLEPHSSRAAPSLSRPWPVSEMSTSSVQHESYDARHGMDAEEACRFLVPSNSDTLDDLLNDEGFLRLQGKKQRGREEIQVIDVSADQQLSDAQEWLTKSLTEEKVHRPSRQKSDLPTQQQRRKHQITYLAFQAKEREFELKNQWAQNRLTKRETQAKYGF